MTCSFCLTGVSWFIFKLELGYDLYAACFSYLGLVCLSLLGLVSLCVMCDFYVFSLGCSEFGF